MKRINIAVDDKLNNKLEQYKLFLRDDLKVSAICQRALDAATSEMSVRFDQYSVGYAQYGDELHSAETKALVKAIMKNKRRKLTERLNDCMTALNCTTYDADYWLGYFTAMSE